MSETLVILPLAFWAVVLLLLIGGFIAVSHIQNAYGLPVIAVLGTVAAWYIGDVLYNDYAGNHAERFSPELLGNAWWQVALFITVFMALVPVLHRMINGRERGTSYLSLVMKAGPVDSGFQSNLVKFFWSATAVWLLLSGIAVLRLRDQTPYYFFPFFGYRADPWGRGQIGGGIDSLLSLAANLQLFVAAMFGLVAALVEDRRIRSFALIGCLLTWPNYIFDRTRNSILVVVLPAVLSWVFLRLRCRLWHKALVLMLCFAIVNAWMGFVIANRSLTDIASAFKEGRFRWEDAEETHHQGLNMFEELCWVNSLLENETISVNWGADYFAIVANPIPRTLWPNKPVIGLDYAVARGQEYTDTGTTATMSSILASRSVPSSPPF